MSTVHRALGPTLSTRRRPPPRPRPTPLQWKSFAGISGSSADYTDTTDFTADCSLVSGSSNPIESSPFHSPTSATGASRPNSPCISPRSGNLAFLASRKSSRESQSTGYTTQGNTSPNPTPSPRTSYRLAKRRQSNFLELPVADYVRPRVCSLPEGAYNLRSSLHDDIYRLRTFSITSKGVVNCGDALIPRRSRSNISMASSTNSRENNLSGEKSPFDGSPCCGSSAVSSEDEGDNDKLAKYRIVLLGAAGVGKSSLLTQFMTSDYINTYDASLDDEFGEKIVSVSLENEESELVFIDHPTSEMSVENSISTYEPHATIVAYSVTDRSSFRAASDILRYLWQEGVTQKKAVILVGNKCDLARARVTTTQEGKALACAHDCKFIETSSGIQHNVDELLVGTLKQCRLRDEKLKKELKEHKNKKKHINSTKTSISLHLAREILGKLCLQNSKSKSCENLHVL